MAGSRPGPAARPAHLKVVEGNPNKERTSKLAGGLKLPPGAPNEPDWSTMFVPAIVPAPRRRKQETTEQSKARELAAAERRAAVADAKQARAWASETWRKVVKILDAQGLISELDWAVLEDCCIVRVRMLQCERDISRNGLRQLSERGWTRNGSITSAMQYRTQFRWLCAQLGLSPVARDFITPDGGDDDGESPFD